ncbi:MAG: hypothetical protein WCY92_11750 [Novosphingobium sp.]
MTTKRTTRGKAAATASTTPESDFYVVDLAARFHRRGTTYLPGRPIRVSAALYREMKDAGVIANGKPA